MTEQGQKGQSPEANNKKEGMLYYVVLALIFLVMILAATMSYSDRQKKQTEDEMTEAEKRLLLSSPQLGIGKQDRKKLPDSVRLPPKSRTPLDITNEAREAKYLQLDLKTIAEEIRFTLADAERIKDEDKRKHYSSRIKTLLRKRQSLENGILKYSGRFGQVSVLTEENRKLFERMRSDWEELRSEYEGLRAEVNTQELLDSTPSTIRRIQENSEKNGGTLNPEEARRSFLELLERARKEKQSPTKFPGGASGGVR